MHLLAYCSQQSQAPQENLVLQVNPEPQENLARQTAQGKDRWHKDYLA